MPTQDELLLKLIYQEENEKALDEATAKFEKLTDAEKELIKTSAKVEKQNKGIGNSLSELKGNYLNVSSMIKDAAGMLGAAWDQTIAQSLRAQEIDAQTANVIKSTGGAAGVSAKQVKQYADELMNVSGIDDEVVRGGENMLLTFTNIGKDVFPSATRTLADMAVAMNNGSTAGLDLKGTAIQLGKALNDPIKGVSALADVGVTFTEEQKNQIKTMMDMNDVAGAQTVILKELQREFGGAAEAAGSSLSGKLSIAKQKFEELKESVGEFLAIGVATGIDAVSFPQKLADAFKASEAKIRADVMAGKMSVDDYNNAIVGMANNMSGVFGPAATQALINQYQLNNEMVRAAQVTDAADRAQTRAAQNQAAQQAEAAQNAANQAAAAQTHTEVMRAYSAELLYNTQQYQAQQAAAAEAAKVQDEYRVKIADAGTAAANAAQQFKGATDAQIKQALAQSQIDTLAKALKDGTISQEGYNKAVDQVLLRYDLATPKSIAVAESQQKVNEAFLNGQLPLKDFVTSSEKIPQIANDGKVTLEELASLGIKPATNAANEQKTTVDQLGLAWGRIPAQVKTVYTIQVNGEPPAGGTSTPNVPKVPGRGYAAGGAFTVPPGYPNDSYPMRVSSGERVIVQPQNSVTNTWNVQADQAGMALLLERQRMMNSQAFEARM